MWHFKFKSDFFCGTSASFFSLQIPKLPIKVCAFGPINDSDSLSVYSSYNKSLCILFISCKLFSNDADSVIPNKRSSKLRSNNDGLIFSGDELSIEHRVLQPSWYFHMFSPAVSKEQPQEKRPWNVPLCSGTRIAVVCSSELKSIVTKVALLEGTTARSVSLICFFCTNQATYGTESHSLRDNTHLWPRSQKETQRDIIVISRC